MGQQNNPFYVSPMMAEADIGGSVMQGMNMRAGYEQNQERRREEDEAAQFRDAWQGAASYQDKLRVMDQFPAQSAKAREQVKFSSDERAGIHATNYAAIMDDPSKALPILQQRIIEGEKAGENMDDTRGDLEAIMNGNMTPEEVVAMAEVEMRGTNEGLDMLDKRAGGGQSAAEKEWRMLTAGMSQEQIDKAKRVKLGLDPRAVTAADKVFTVNNVPYIYDEQRGKARRVNIDGTEMTGESVGAEAAAQDKQSVLAKGAAQASADAIGKLPALRENIRNLRKLGPLIDSGAGTGPIEKFFPSFKSASVELDNLRASLGLDVVGAASFGALSEGELNLALDVALPTGLKGPELKAWAERKIAAQDKLATELENAAIYLAKPGNSQAGYLEMLRNQNEAATGDQKQKVDDLVNKYGNAPTT